MKLAKFCFRDSGYENRCMSGSLGLVEQGTGFSGEKAVNRIRNRRTVALRNGAELFRDICIWATVAITVYSGLTYIQRAVSMYVKGGGAAAG